MNEPIIKLNDIMKWNSSKILVTTNYLSKNYVYIRDIFEKHEIDIKFINYKRIMKIFPFLKVSQPLYKIFWKREAYSDLNLLLWRPNTTVKSGDRPWDIDPSATTGSRSFSSQTRRERFEISHRNTSYILVIR